MAKNIGRTNGIAGCHGSLPEFMPVPLTDRGEAGFLRVRRKTGEVRARSFVRSIDRPEGGPACKAVDSGDNVVAVSSSARIG
jgi:hypothetical protein